MKGKRTISGIYDRRGLPKHWEQFVHVIKSFMNFYGSGDLFDKSLYTRAHKQEDEFIFCNVVFEEGGSSYWYLADTDDYLPGDYAVVAAGKDNHPAVVRIESIEYRTKEDAPFPVEKTKHILRRYIPGAAEEDDIESEDLV